jgi:dipeptidyl aminopeptidase/acylaminoacyl peptidase
MTRLPTTLEGARRTLCWAIVVLSATNGMAWAQFAPEDFARIEWIGETAISPGGAQVAYTRLIPRRLNEPPGGPRRELWIVSTAGGEPKQLVGPSWRSSAPAWLPDGSDIAFLCRTESSAAMSRVCTVALAGGQPRPLTPPDISVVAFAFSADGKQLAYTARDPDRRDNDPLRPDPIVVDEMTPHVRLWVASVVSGKGQAISPANLTVRSFTWSPDSRTLALQATEGTDRRAGSLFRRLYTVSSSGGELRPLTATEGALGPMTFSPDGRRFAFLGATSLNEPEAQSVFVVSASAGVAINRTPEYEGSAEWLAWLDSETILFGATEGIRTVLNRVRADQGGIERVLDASPACFYFPIAPSLDASRRMFAAVMHSAMRPDEIHVGTLESPQVRRLTNHNVFIDRLKLAKQEGIEWRGADRWRIEGVLVRPLDERPGRRYPLVVAPHGGPDNVTVDGWNTWAESPAQVLAARGFFVLRPNYRGSTGRGVAFSRANERDLAGRDFDDILAGIDHLVRLGLVDPDRVGIEGQSYGGYLAAWAATRHSRRFKAAVVNASASNVISHLVVNYDALHSPEVHWGLDWLHNPGLLWDRSPLAHVRSAQTPTLILHGLEDETFSHTLAVEFYRALKLVDVPTRLVLYPREGHEFVEPGHQVDVIRRTLDWLERYLRK